MRLTECCRLDTRGDYQIDCQGRESINNLSQGLTFSTFILMAPQTKTKQQEQAKQTQAKQEPKEQAEREQTLVLGFWMDGVTNVQNAETDDQVGNVAKRTAGLVINRVNRNLGMDPPFVLNDDMEIAWSPSMYEYSIILFAQLTT